MWLPGSRRNPAPRRPPVIVDTKVTLPTEAMVGYRRYFVKDYPDDRQVALYFANEAAMHAAAAGKALPDVSAIVVEVHAARLDDAGKTMAGADGHFLPGKLMSLTGMSREAGWGDAIPSMLRNENWNYAVFDANRKRITEVNPAECMVCHTTRKDTSFLFLYDEMAAAARSVNRP